jgi:predicted nucleic acid-binding protein
MDRIVCIDSHIVIWGIKNQSEPSQNAMREKAKIFLEQLDQNKIQVLIPAIVIGETLIKEMEQKHPVFVKVFSENFIVGDFNIGAAQIYARIMKKRLEKDKSTEKIKFDMAIAATAIFYGASCIYTYDPDLNYVNDIIEIRQIPDIYTQSAFDFKGW